MSDIIIKAEHVGKSYFIGHQRQRGYTALRDVLAQKAKGFVKGIKNTFTGQQLIDGQEIEEFWALKDISFEINKGEAVGIIGRNGAGKSTLLKVLSRITEPTQGRITLDGRVASLLEVGTGFHPELTGRENIYLNGAILGMSRNEIKSKFDEIVDFSGVEKFLDTPVKRYSSGMYVRLAFSIAAHLEPEILVVDEVLAVGDAEFQKKCLGKMNDVSKKEGRTVLFVSHDMGSISQLCTSSMLLEKGRLVSNGRTDLIIKEYLKIHKSDKGYVTNVKNKKKSLNKITLLNTENKESYSFAHNEEIQIKFELEIDEWINGLYLAYAIQNNLNKRICLDYVELEKSKISTLKNIVLNVLLPREFLAPGAFSLDVSIISPNIEMYDAVFGVCSFEIVDNNSKITKFSKADYGDVLIKSSHFFS